MGLLNEWYAWVIEEGPLGYFVDGGFSNELYNLGAYGSIGFVTTLSALVFNVLFYYVLSRPKLSKWYHWAIFGSISIVLTAIATYYLSFSAISMTLNFNQSIYIGLVLHNSIISLAAYLLFMLLIRWWSTHSRKTPFPH
jgi:hypothetical protein